jgi:purine-binding chemotaxis protein CheW
MDRRLYGMNVSSLQEISTNFDITPVPPAPAAVRGLANLRSRVFLILDLRPMLGLVPIACTPDSRIIILKPDLAEDIGLLVDGGGDIVVVPQDRIELPHSGLSASESPRQEKDLRLVQGVCKLETDLLMIIDARRLEQVVAELMHRET